MAAALQQIGLVLAAAMGPTWLLGARNLRALTWAIVGLVLSVVGLLARRRLERHRGDLLILGAIPASGGVAEPIPRHADIERVRQLAQRDYEHVFSLAGEVEATPGKLARFAQRLANVADFATVEIGNGGSLEAVAFMGRLTVCFAAARNLDQRNPPNIVWLAENRDRLRTFYRRTPAPPTGQPRVAAVTQQGSAQRTPNGSQQLALFIDVGPTPNWQAARTLLSQRAESIVLVDYVDQTDRHLRGAGDVEEVVEVATTALCHLLGQHTDDLELHIGLSTPAYLAAALGMQISRTRSLASARIIAHEYIAGVGYIAWELPSRT